MSGSNACPIGNYAIVPPLQLCFHLVRHGQYPTSRKSSARKMANKLSMLALLVTHPLEFRTLLQYWLFHEQKRDITSQQEHPTSGWDRASMRRCWDFLDMTSRSFAAVIKELDGDLARTVRCHRNFTTASVLTTCRFACFTSYCAV